MMIFGFLPVWTPKAFRSSRRRHKRRANAICERIAGTLRRELLDRILIGGPGHLHRILAECTIHDNAHRPHQSLNQWHPDADTAFPAPTIDLTVDGSNEGPSSAASSANKKLHRPGNVTTVRARRVPEVVNGGACGAWRRASAGGGAGPVGARGQGQPR